jgi:hypothetical protein
MAATTPFQSASTGFPFLPSVTTISSSLMSRTLTPSTTRYRLSSVIDGSCGFCAIRSTTCSSGVGWSSVCAEALALPVRAAHVLRPIFPSRLRPLRSWNALTRSSMVSSKTPSWSMGSAMLPGVIQYWSRSCLA